MTYGIKRVLYECFDGDLNSSLLGKSSAVKKFPLTDILTVRFFEIFDGSTIFKRIASKNLE